MIGFIFTRLRTRQAPAETYTPAAPGPTSADVARADRRRAARLGKERQEATIRELRQLRTAQLRDELRRAGRRPAF